MRDLLLLAIAVLAVTGNAFAEVYKIPRGPAESSSKTRESNVHLKQIDLLPHATEERGVDCPLEGYTFLPHESSCTKYYSCENGNKYMGECPEGMIYDYIREVCDSPHAAICINQKYNDFYNNDNNCHFPSDCPSFGHSRYSHEIDCSLYYECSNGRKCLLKCFDGHVFNPVISTCDIPKNVPNCRSYMKLLMTCKSGQLFDYTEERCIDSSHAYCYMDSNTRN
ncbi:peritrophin-1-like [Bombus impatiens]|uniref:Peritrophin-1-like n=1 Tax=Bombus impatiens TaxID=132113 RepID=A0A6P8LMM8_BOMIM|nr:peritrophin-1-like [Bombus impatiens]